MSKPSQQILNQINALANTLLTGNLSSWDREKAEKELFQLCMEGVGLGRYAYAGRVSGNMVNDYQASKYNGELTSKAWKAIWKIFDGSQDFFSLFEQYYHVKSRGLTAEHLKWEYGDEQAAKAQEVRAYLKRVARKRGLKLTKMPSNLLNKKNLEKYMLDNGFSDGEIDEVLNPHTGLLANTFVSGDGAAQDQREDENPRQALQLQTRTYSDWKSQELAQDGFAYQMEQTRNAVAGTEKEKILRYLITFGVYATGYENATMDCVEKLIDADFYRFLEQQEDFQKPVDAITAYTGKDRNTIRKDIAKLSKLLVGRTSAEGNAA